MSLLTLLNGHSSDSSKSIAHATKSVVDSLEERKLFSSPLAITSLVIENRTNSDGSPRNASAVVVTFNGNVTLAANGFRGVRISAPGINLISGNEQRYSMRGTGGGAVTGRPNALRISFGSLIPSGSRFNIDAGAIKDAQNRDVVRTSSATDNRFRTGVTREQATLAQRVWRPTDFTLFDRTNFGSAPVASTANTSPAASTVRANLDTFLQAKVTRGIITEAQKTAAMTTFDSSTASAIAPDANIRAAIVSLTGTVAESAIQAYFGTANSTGRTWTTVSADGSRFGSDAKYAETRVSNAGRLQTIVNPIYQGEDFRSLSALFAHEALHQDAPNSVREETIANAIETIVWAQQLDVDSGPADDGTQLVARQNFRLLSMLNSGRANFPGVGLGEAGLRNPSGGVLAGGTPVSGNAGQTVNSFVADLRVEYAARGFDDFGDQPGNGTLNSYMQRITGAASTAAFSFNDSTINAIDRNQRVITPSLAVKLGRILKLQWTA